MIRVLNLRSAGFVNDPTAMDADITTVCGAVTTLVGVATVCYADGKRYPALSFSEEASERFEAQSDHDHGEVLQAMLKALEVTDE